MFFTSRNCHFRLFLGGFLISDDMKDDALDSLWFLFKYYEMVEIGPKIFLAHFVSFFVYALLHPELRPKILPNERPY